MVGAFASTTMGTSEALLSATRLLETRYVHFKSFDSRWSGVDVQGNKRKGDDRQRRRETKPKRSPLYTIQETTKKTMLPNLHRERGLRVACHQLVGYHADRICVLALLDKDALVGQSRGPSHRLRGEKLVGSPDNGIPSCLWPKQQAQQEKNKIRWRLG